MEINYLILNNALRIILLIHFNPRQWSISELVYNPLWLFQNCQLGKLVANLNHIQASQKKFKNLYGKLNTTQ